MPTASCLRPPLPHSSASASAARGLRVPLPSPPPPAQQQQQLFQAALRLPRRRLAGVGVVAASASPFDELYARGRPAHGSSKVVIFPLPVPPIPIPSPWSHRPPSVPQLIEQFDWYYYLFISLKKIHGWFLFFWVCRGAAFHLPAPQIWLGEPPFVLFGPRAE